MTLEYIHKDSSREIINLNLTQEITNNWINIDSSSKKEFVQAFIPAFNSGQKIVLFDKNHTKLLKFYKENDLNSFEGMNEVNKIAKLLFFTSGSTGFPVGAFKSKENILKEVEVLKNLLNDFNIKRVVVSVPFIHIYGILAGLLLPLHLEDISLIVKEDFLPYELLEEASYDDTLIITTPLFIKALCKVSDDKELTKSLFISSTGPLHLDDVTLFQNRYKTTLIQLFGSTETGGIAYKKGINKEWDSLMYVDIKSEDERLALSSPFISKYLLENTIKEIRQPFQTQDIVEINDNKFTLLGRANKLIKIAGKRISALEIESIIETIPSVVKAVVSLVYKKELLRSEQILITLQTENKIDKKLIKEKIAQNFGTLTIPFKVEYVDTINYSSMGKVIF
ncbi:AMP-binding protein [Sulfurimonas sp.]|uniref:AMP-binding protein n=1 Tax=Sulfurimonas sp. TaxID=2022749 RepID=UPI0025CD28DB|nr:AMP-binding protein [Sulfurimonas sp.]